MNVKRNWGAAVVLTLSLLSTARGGVVVNEVFYNAPNDLDGVQWLELHNAGDAAVDVGGWTLDGGKVYTFPPGTSIDGRGFVVVALDVEEFKKAYKDVAALGPLKRRLKRGGERIELRDAAGATVDVVRYKDEAPWPASADGYSASLERICPTAPGDSAENWAGSPLPDKPAPAGTPGKQNANYSAAVPPVVTVGDAPATVAPDQPLRVEAQVKGGAVREVTLLYQNTAPGKDEGKEVAVPMAAGEGGRFVASIPAQPADTLVRYRVKATGEGGAERLFPAEHDLRPTLSTYVHGPWEPAKVSFGIVLLGGPDRAAAAAQEQRQPFGPGRFGPPGRFRGPGPGGFGPPPGGLGPPPGAPRQQQPAAPGQQPPGPPGGGFGPPGGFGPRGGFGPPGRFGPPGFGREAEETPRAPRGTSAFLYVDHDTGRATLFDYVNAVQRGRRPGFKIFFHKDRPLNHVTAVSMVFEGSEMSLLAEALSYDVYRRAGNAAPLTEFVRLWVDGKMAGYQLMVERPNKSFLRRNKLAGGGNLYKARWFGQGIVGQHVKKTNTQTGHEDLIAVVDALEAAAADADKQWQVIQDNFDIDEMATFFAVNTALSHWDGFFNNYYTYHDPRTNKWQMYPWDHDQTWGIVMMGPFGGRQMLTDMPLTFGMEGDQPPGVNQNGDGGFRGGPFGGGPGWWRPGGYFSRPLLANAHFRKIFLARLRYVLENVYTPENYDAFIDRTAAAVREDAALRARLNDQDAEAADAQLRQNVEFLKTHLRKRREFLLQQDELRADKK
jgi:hypothetical protein